MSNFEKLSQEFLLKFLKEPWGFSFFPSSLFWKEGLSKNSLKEIFSSFFESLYLEDNHKLNLYIHIPFCSRICSYCNCFKIYSNTSSDIDKYIDFLEKEAFMYYKKNSNNKIKINSLFIWWWTPNILSVEQFNKLFSIVEKYFDLSILREFLVDCHPNHLDKEKINLFDKLWVNRITLAIQSLDEKVLSLNNRDCYDLSHINNLINHISKTKIKINIDLLIWLVWQDFDSIKKDIDYFNSKSVDNISDHFFMLSNNINYNLPDYYLDTIIKAKNYLKEVWINSNSSNVQEDDYSSRKSSIISLWSYGVTSIFSSIIYSKPNIQDYYESLSDNKLPFSKWFLLSKIEEQIKYIYLNILSWINVKEFYNIFEENIFEVFHKEIKFLYGNDIILKEGNMIISKKNDLETFTYLWIFFLPLIKSTKIDFSLNLEWELSNFFLEDWSLIDR